MTINTMDVIIEGPGISINPPPLPSGNRRHLKLYQKRGMRRIVAD
jgi:hypothetical protein